MCVRATTKLCQSFESPPPTVNSSSGALCVCVCGWAGKGVWHPIDNPVWWDSSITRFYPPAKKPRSSVSSSPAVCPSESVQPAHFLFFYRSNFHWRYVSLTLSPCLSSPSSFPPPVGSPSRPSIRAIHGALTANIACKAQAARPRGPQESVASSVVQRNTTQGHAIVSVVAVWF